MASIVTGRRPGPKPLLPAGALRHRRRLPWRGVRDPYAVLVSEIMLQQTQVARVLEFYPRFLARYPTLEDLAGARGGEKAGRAAAASGGGAARAPWHRPLHGGRGREPRLRRRRARRRHQRGARAGARVRGPRAAKERAPGAAGVGAGRGARAARAGGGLEPGADGPGGDVLRGAEAAVWRVSRAATLCRWGALGFGALGRPS